MKHLPKGYDPFSSGNIFQLLLTEIPGQQQKSPVHYRRKRTADDQCHDVPQVREISLESSIHNTPVMQAAPAGIMNI